MGTTLACGATHTRQRGANIFLSDMAHYAAMNAVYREYFPAEPPARWCIQCGLVKPEFLVEISAVAHLG